MWVHNPGDCPERLYGEGCGGEAQYLIDPYAADIYGEENWEWLCDGVYRGRAMDI